MSYVSLLIGEHLALKKSPLAGCWHGMPMISMPSDGSYGRRDLSFVRRNDQPGSAATWRKPSLNVYETDFVPLVIRINDPSPRPMRLEEHGCTPSKSVIYLFFYDLDHWCVLETGHQERKRDV